MQKETSNKFNQKEGYAAFLFDGYDFFWGFTLFDDDSALRRFDMLWLTLIDF